VGAGFSCAEIIRIFQRQRSRRLPSGVQQRAFETLNPIDAATRLDDLRLPPSNHLEALKGDRAGQWSIRSNDPWRVCCRWEGADTHDVEIVDDHRQATTMTRKLAPVHPGRYLRETLEELGISARQFALHIGTTPRRLSLVLRGMRPVSADLALRLERALGQSAASWVNLQARFDLDVAINNADATVKRIRRLDALRA
jgi:proteic killer suppression protein